MLIDGERLDLGFVRLHLFKFRQKPIMNSLFREYRLDLGCKISFILISGLKPII